MGLTARVVRNDFPQAPAKLKAAVSAAFHAVGPSILSSAQSRTPVDTGALRSSELVEFPTDMQMRFSAGRGLPDDRAVYVHQGTYKMGARPFLKSAVDDGLPDVENALAAQIQAGLS